jgi:phospholipase D1/2
VIDTIEQNSGVTFTEAQAALARQWISGDTITDQKEVVLGVPQPGDIFVLDKEDNKLKAKPVTVKAPIPTDDGARRVLEEFQNGFNGVSDQVVSDNVGQHMLAADSSLFDEPWLGTEAEELYA